ncbi:MAG: creatininase family protein [Candidatus Thorarchaeota archaeon]|nr:MAG: creatininase family protein [Candidatus Thorarchaeota archaeon]
MTIMEKLYMLTKMTWKEVEERLKESDTVLVPIGSMEQHGPALPLDNDHFIARRFAEKVVERLWETIKLVVAPTISIGYSEHHMDFKGTITLRESTLVDVIVDVCRSLAAHGFRRIVLINGHGGNQSAIRNALNLFREGMESQVFAINWWDMAKDKIREVGSRPFFHACDNETSVAWYLGQRVLADKRVDEPGRKIVPGYIEPDMAGDAFTVSGVYSMKDITDSGVVGYSTKATEEKGKQIVDVAVERMVDFILRILEM